MLQIFNTLSRTKQAFQPIEPAKVRMYVCGMTVYDYCHLGHARVLIVFDIIYRHLQALGFAVTYVRNITDIDDKIIQRAAENGEPISALTERFITAMHEDAAALQVLPPTLEPKATENITAIINMITVLIDKGYAYRADNGDVYYRVRQFADYGKLSGKQLADLQAGARVEVDQHKQDPLDFVLWKHAKADEPSWESPWGNGRPGWHIECSAMSTQHLGAQFDIHGGGQDLQFPHHENEIAQSEACSGHTYVNYWIHNGFVRVNEAKMSKSSGNFFTVREILKKFDAETIRFFILNSHYRSELNYSDEELTTARTALSRLYTALRGLPDSAAGDFGQDYQQRFMQSMNDDFNTADALAVLFDLAHTTQRLRNTQPEQAAQAGKCLRQLGAQLGILQQSPEDYLQQTAHESELSTAAIEALIAERTTARQAKNWAESDRIRNELQTQGILLEDNADGTLWRRA